jgi:hypothetical protein
VIKKIAMAVELIPVQIRPNGEMHTIKNGSDLTHSILSSFGRGFILIPFFVGVVNVQV